MIGEFAALIDRHADNAVQSASLNEDVVNDGVRAARQLGPVTVIGPSWHTHRVLTVHDDELVCLDERKQPPAVRVQFLIAFAVANAAADSTVEVAHDNHIAALCPVTHALAESAPECVAGRRVRE